MSNSLNDVIQGNPRAFDPMILAALAVNQDFYNAHAPKIRAYEEVTNISRFSTSEAREIFLRIQDFRDREGGMDTPIPAHTLRAMVDFYLQNGSIPDYLHPKMMDLITTMEPFMTTETPNLVAGNYFRTWFTYDTVTDIMEKFRRSQVEIKPTEAMEVMNQVIALASQNQDNSITPTQSLIDPNAGMTADIVLPWATINDRLGGGLQTGDSTIMAAMTGGGKTVCATQISSLAAYRGNKVLFVSTEQPPHELMVRIISNHCNIPAQEFTHSHGQLIIPRHIQSDAEQMRQILSLTTRLTENLRFLNWNDGQGRSVEQDLEPELQEVQRGGFKPELLVFDWIGGALSKNQKKERREWYLEAAEFLHDLPKRHNLHALMFAQLSNVKANNKKMCTAQMLEECTSMGNRATNAIYISALRASLEGEGDNYKTEQCFNIDKGRKANTGLAKVDREFQYQRFVDRGRRIVTPSANPATIPSNNQ